MMKFDRVPASLTAEPCGCKLWDGEMDEVVKRFNQPHDIDVRANILCPKCKDRVIFLSE